MESTQSTYANQGPKILGEIEYVDESASGYDFAGDQVGDEYDDNMEYVKSYEGLFSNQTTAVRDELRSNNPLEKELTPVHSYNDQSVVFTTTQLKTFTGWTGTDDDFIEFMTLMDDEDLAEPVFRRIDSEFYDDTEYSVPTTDDGSQPITAEDLGLYALMGYTFKSSFIGTTDFDLLGGFGDYSTEDISSYASKMQGEVIEKYVDDWREGSYNEMMEFMYTGTDTRMLAF